MLISDMPIIFNGRQCVIVEEGATSKGKNNAPHREHYSEHYSLLLKVATMRIENNFLGR